MYQPDNLSAQLRPRAERVLPSAATPPLRVLWLAPWPYAYEAYTHPVPWVVALAQELARLPAEIDLTIVNWEPSLATEEEHFAQDGLHFVFLKVPRYRLDILSLYQLRVARVARWLRQHYRHYDVIHLHGSELQLPAMAARLPTREVPVVLSVQGLVSECVKYVPEFSWYKTLWTLAGYYERAHLPGIRHFLCRTHWDAAHAARLSPGAHIHHNWEMLRPEFYAVAQQPLPPAAAQPPRILFVGGHQVMKGFRETLAVFARLREQVPGLRLAVAGTVGAREWTAETHRAGLSAEAQAAVERVGFQTAAQLVQLMGRCFCLLHPSYIDNSPNAVCEAQMAGLPVVASAVGGLSSLIEDGQTGLLAPLQVEELAAQVLRLWQQPALRTALATAGRARALERHHPPTIVQRTFDLYRALARPVSATS